MTAAEKIVCAIGEHEVNIVKRDATYIGTDETEILMNFYVTSCRLSGNGYERKIAGIGILIPKDAEDALSNDILYWVDNDKEQHASMRLQEEIIKEIIQYADAKEPYVKMRRNYFDYCLEVFGNSDVEIKGIFRGGTDLEISSTSTTHSAKKNTAEVKSGEVSVLECEKPNNDSTDFF